MTSFSIAYNTSTTMYEIHAAGCRHMNLASKFEPCGDYEGDTAKDVAARFEARNEGCLTRLGPCVK